MQRSPFALQARKWWYGLFPLAAIWLATGSFMTTQIEADLASRATADAPRSSWASVHVNGRDVAIDGTSPAQSTRIQLAAATDNVWGVRLVNDRAKDLLAMHPFRWGAKHDETHIILSGYVSPGGARATLTSEARKLFPGMALTDTMEDAAGSPAAFDTLTVAALAQLAHLTTGSVSSSDTSLTIRGAASSEQIRQDILAAIQRMPAPITLATADITAPAAPAPVETSSIATPSSYVWLARRENKHVTLSGFVPDETAHKAIVSSADKNFSGLSLDDQLKVSADGAPAGFTGAAELGIIQLARLETGSATITNKQLTVVGLAATEEIASDTKTQVAKAPAGFTGDATVVARPKPVQVAVAAPQAAAPAVDCTAELKSASTPGKIQFESWKSVILPQSMPVLDNVAGILKRCPDLKVQVSGHTDNTGQTSLNRALSFRRASAVVTTLTKAGIDKARLKSEGFGASRPIAKNETSAGRAANRRIEFNIVQ
jgi:OmpA-OmpF porin, OOP family